MLFLKKDAKEKQIETILLQNYNRYYRLACSYTHNGADAADIVQNGAYQAILNGSSLKNIEFAETWVYRIMLNEIFRFLKKDAHISTDSLSEEAAEEDSYEDIDLKRALDRLPSKDKAVIVLKYFEGLTFEEIADALEENINTIKSRLYRSLKKLRLDLSEEWHWD